jgi:hypothetical protein
MTHSGQLPAASVRDEHGFAMGEWLTRQRIAEQHGRLLPSRRAALDAELPGWFPIHRGDDAGWFDRLHAAKVWSAEHDDAIPKAKHINRDGVRIGVWVRNQRSAAANGRLTGIRAAAFDAAFPDLLHCDQVQRDRRATERRTSPTSSAEGAAARE